MLLPLIIFLFIKKISCENNNVQQATRNYPFVVGIGFNDTDLNIFKHVCSGCFIVNHWVITAGKCTALERNYFVSIPEYKNESVSITKFNVLKLYVYTKDASNSTVFGLMRVEDVPFEVPLPMLPVYDYIDIGEIQRAVFVQFHAESETRPFQVFDAAISKCPDGMENVVCVEDKHDDIYSFGGPLLQDDTIIGIYTAYLEEDKKEFVPVSRFLNWISQCIELFQNESGFILRNIQNSTFEERDKT